MNLQRQEMSPHLEIIILLDVFGFHIESVSQKTKICKNVLFFLQKMFHEDVVQVVRKRLELEEDLPEAQRPTALARSYYLKVLSDILEKKQRLLYCSMIMKLFLRMYA